MKEELKNLLTKAYAPYSNFQVAAIIVMNDGKMIKGVNVENASYGATICAERNAITTAVTCGYQKSDFKELHVMVNNEKISSCCFMCRQLIVEFFTSDKEIYLYNNLGESQKYLVKDVCPLPFTEGDLK